MVDESTSIQGFRLRYITLFYVIWLKNDRLSMFDENIGIGLGKHFDLYFFQNSSSYAYYTYTYLIVVKLSFLHTL